MALLRVRAPVHVDRAEGVRPADVEEVDLLLVWQLDELNAVRRLEFARDAGGLAPCVRLELVDLTISEDRARPRPERQLINRLNRNASDAGSRQPDAFLRGCGPLQQDATGRVARRWPSGPSAAAAAALLHEEATTHHT